MILKKPAKRRYKYIYYDDARLQLNVRSDVFDMVQAPPGTDYWGESKGRGPDDSDERQDQFCEKGRETTDREDFWKVGYKRDNNEWEDNDFIPGREDTPYTADSIRWTEEDWLRYEQAQNEI